MSDFNQLRSPDGISHQSASSDEQLTTVQGLVSEDRVEQRLAEVLGILYANIADLAGFNEAEEARLREIAELCPLDEGFGVYIARSALLKLDTLPRHYISECERMPNQEAINSQKIGQSETTQNEFSIYPNPNNGAMTLGYTLQQDQIGILSIFSIVGNKVYERQLDHSNSVVTFELDDLSSGIYQLRVDVNGEQQFTEKMTIVRE